MTEQLSDTELQVIEHLLLEAGCITPEDKCLLLFDDTTTSLATGFIKVSNRIKMPIIALHIPVATRHGCEPPEIIQSSMCQYTLIIALTYFSLAHTQARVKAGLHGARFLSLPMYNRVMLMDPSLRFNYRQQRNIVESVTESLNIGNTIHVNGCINMEFIQSKGKYYLIDINPRFSAGVAFSHMAGYNMVLNHLNCFIVQDIQAPVLYQEQIITKRYREEIL